MENFNSRKKLSGKNRVSDMRLKSLFTKVLKKNKSK